MIINGNYHTGRRIKNNLLALYKNHINFKVIIIVPDLPASLRIHQKENIVVIDPRPYIIGVIYNVTSVNNLIKDGIFNGSGILVMRSNLAINLSFTCITTSITFNLGEFLHTNMNAI